MANPSALYQEVILDHNKNPRNFGSLERPSHHAVGHNPLCGDHIRVELMMSRKPGHDVVGESIEGIAFQGEACAICKSSASMMTMAVKGKTRSEAEVLMKEFLALATGKIELADAVNIGRLRVFSGIRDLPVRVKCAILPWHTLHAALNAIESTSTEVELDPMRTPIDDA
jgi:nitrogen fixation NifU-like protein